jgi:hypothetical protein
LFSNGHSALRFLRGGNRAESMVLGIIGIAQFTSDTADGMIARS